MTIVIVRVRTGGLCHSHLKPSTMSRRTWKSVLRSGRGATTRDTSTAPSATNRAWARNGQAIPAANRAAPIGGPASWLAVMKPAISRALPIGRSARSTTIGSKVWEVVSAKVSAVPSRNIATRTTAMLTWPVTIEAYRTTSTSARSRSTVTTIARRSRRSARAPAYSPKSSHGSCWSRTAIATRKGSCVWEATSSGPAEIEIPSPMLLIHDDARSHRKGRPSRTGAMTSAIRLTSRG